jgi:hypothetical protein
LIEEYQGHTNWETWNVSLWLNNDEGMYNECLEICNKDTNPHGYEHHRKKQLEEYVFDLLDDGIITDKISIHRVDFKSIMEDFQQTIEENKEYQLGMRKAELGRRTDI